MVDATDAISLRINDYANKMSGKSGAAQQGGTADAIINVMEVHKKLLDSLRHKQPDVYCLLVSLASCYNTYCMPGDVPPLSHDCPVLDLACTCAAIKQSGIKITDAVSQLMLMRSSNLLRCILTYHKQQGQLPRQPMLQKWTRFVDSMMPKRHLTDREVQRRVATQAMRP